MKIESYRNDGKTGNKRLALPRTFSSTLLFRSLDNEVGETRKVERRDGREKEVIMSEAKEKKKGDLSQELFDQPVEVNSTYPFSTSFILINNFLVS